MDSTTLGLKKPLTSEAYDIQIFNDNADKTNELILADREQINSLGLLAEIKVTSADVTSIAFDGLDINTDEQYKLYCEILNPTANTCAYDISCNNDVVYTNYHNNQTYITTTTFNGNAGDNSQIMYCPNGNIVECVSIINILLINGYPFFRSIGGYNGQVRNGNIVKKAKVANITSIEITADRINGIGIGSRFRLYKGR